MGCLESRLVHIHVKPIPVLIALYTVLVLIQYVLRINFSFLAVTGHFILHQTECIGIYSLFHTCSMLHAKQTGIRDTCFFGRTFLSGNDDHAIGRIHTVDSCRSIFQNGDAFDVFRTKLRQFILFTGNTVNNHQRVTITTDTDHVVKGSRLTRLLSDQQSRHLTLNIVHQVLRLGRLDIIRLDSRHGTRQRLLLLNAIAHHHNFFQDLGIFYQGYFKRSLTVYTDFLSLITDIAYNKRCSRSHIA